MKKILMAFFILSIVKSLSAQDDLCFTKTTRAYIKLGDVEINDLTTSEMLSTRQRTSVIREREYLDGDREYVRTYKYIYEKNFFPDWYVKPDEVVINQHGRYNFFYSTSTIYEGGWEGWRRTGSSYGQYLEGSGEFAHRRNYYIPHDSLMQRDYSYIRDEMRVRSVQWYKRFVIPTQEVLNQYIDAGYTVTVINGIITIQGDDIIRIINTVQKSDTFIADDDNGNTVTTVTTYKYFEEVDDVLMNKITNTTPITLSTGDCAVKVMEVVYDDYSHTCNENSSPQLGQRSKKEIDENIKLYPNPAINSLTISLPDGMDYENTNITIYNNLGFLLEDIKPTSKDVTIPIGNYIAGMYQCVIHSKENYFIKSFVKQ